MNLPAVECLGCGEHWPYGETPQDCTCMDSVWRITYPNGRVVDYDENEFDDDE